MKPDICIYHAPCQDGFTAAWAIWKRWPDVEFVPGVYGAEPPDVTRKRVLLVDFSYKAPVLRRMAESAAFVAVLDHHKSAEADLADFAVDAIDWQPRFEDQGLAGLAIHNIQAKFDMTRSGAMLAWEYAHPGELAPGIVQHVQDRDLWRFHLPYTRETAAVLFSHDYDFAAWSMLAAELGMPAGCHAIIREGAAIERKHHKDVAELLKMTTRPMVIGGACVPVANLPYTVSSDAANALAEGQPFGACYYDNADGRRVFSLRSKADGADVSEIAATYGGGGHARAAGFSMPIGWEGDYDPRGVMV